jgi:hypothetical protein
MNSSESYKKWLEALAQRGKFMVSAMQSLSKLPKNPFEARERVAVLTARLGEYEIEVPQELREVQSELDRECQRLDAEFWSTFHGACQQNSWSLEGTTSRRILQRAIFVNSRDGVITVEELQLSATPFVPELVDLLRGHIEGLIPRGFKPQTFLNKLAAAYDSLSGPPQRPLESVYRAFVCAAQKPAFWTTSNSKSFTSVTRPSFRACLAEALQNNAVCSDGRIPQFGTSLSPNDIWEIYSPGEGRCVQVGRISFSR